MEEHAVETNISEYLFIGEVLIGFKEAEELGTLLDGDADVGQQVGQDGQGHNQLEQVGQVALLLQRQQGHRTGSLHEWGKKSFNYQ